MSLASGNGAMWTLASAAHMLQLHPIWLCNMDIDQNIPLCHAEEDAGHILGLITHE